MYLRQPNNTNLIMYYHDLPIILSLLRSSEWPSARVTISPRQRGGHHKGYETGICAAGQQGPACGDGSQGDGYSACKHVMLDITMLIEIETYCFRLNSMMFRRELFLRGGFNCSHCYSTHYSDHVYCLDRYSYWSRKAQAKICQIGD